MNERFPVRNGFSDAYTQHRGPVLAALVVSLTLHILVFAVLTLLPDWSFRRRPPVPDVLNVTMVSLATPGSGPKAGPIAPDSGGTKEGHATVAEPPKPKPEPPKPKTEPPKPEPPKPAPEKVPEPPKPEPKPEPLKQPIKEPAKPVPEAVSLAPKKENAKPPEPVQKPQPQPQAPSLKETLAKLEKKVAQTPQDPLKATLDRLRATVGKEETTQPKTGAGMGTGTAGGTGAASAQGGQGGDSTTGMPGLGLQAMQAIDFYRSLIGLTIEKNWFFNEHLSGGRKDLVTVLVIKILPNGEIADIWYERKSGNANFDDVAFKAVKKSNPLPPLPKEYTRPYYEVGLVFTPAGLNKG